MLFIIIHILFAIVNIIEAKLESIIIRMKNPAVWDYERLDALEHRWSAAYYVAIISPVIGILISVYGFSWQIVLFTISLLLNRRLTFDYPLKIFRRRPLKAIEGTYTIDKLMRGLLGRNGGYVEAFLILGLLTGFYYLTHNIF